MKSFISKFLSLALVLPIFASFPITNANAVTVDTQSNLYQKKVLFVGDSICEAYNEWHTSTPGWAGRIIAWNDMAGLNKGKSGASLSNVRGSNTVLNQLITQKGIDYNYVIIQGGANDAWDSAPVGKMTKGFNGPFDMTTFSGGLETTLKYAKENFPNASLGFIFPFQMPSANYARLSYMSQYFTAAKLICDKWEIPYLDFYFDQDFNDNVMKSSTLTNLQDYIHPNTAGYNILSPIINDWMETLPTTRTTSKNIARHKPYTVSGTGQGFYYEHEQYGVMDYTGDLTDQQISEWQSYNNEWFAFYNGELTSLHNTVDGVGTVIIDLEQQADMESFGIHFWNCDGANLKAPKSVNISVSEDGNVYTQVGSLNITTTDNTVYWADLTAEASGRYVKVDVELDSMYCFLNEIEVNGVLIPDENTSGGDIEVDTNVALDKPYTISGSGDGFYNENADGSITRYQAKLTDGINSDFQNFNNEWFAFFQGSNSNTINGIGSVIIDLQGNYRLYNVRAHLWNCDGAGLKAPYAIDVSVSDNGVDFESVGSVEINFADNTIYWGKSNSFNAKGRYVKLDFQLQSTFAFVNEIHVYGTPVEDKYEGKENIALNKDYAISGSGEGFYYVSEEYGTMDYTANLTDGEFTELQDYSNNWFAFYQGPLGTPNTVNGIGTAIIDLGSKYDITDVRAHLWNCNGASAPAPYSVNISVSDNGTDFVSAGSLNVRADDNTVYWADAEITAKGRYVKLDFELQSTFAMLNEIEIYGTEAEDDEEEQKPEILVGDVNGDGEIKATDYFALKALCLGNASESNFNNPETVIERADMNGNGRLDAPDYFILKKKILSDN